MRFEFICVLLLILAVVEAKKKKKATTTTASPDSEDGDSSGDSQANAGGQQGRGGDGGRGGGHGGGRRSWNHGGQQGGPTGVQQQEQHMANMNNPFWDNQVHTDVMQPAFVKSQSRLPFNVPDFIEEQDDDVKQELWAIWTNESATITERLAALDTVAANVSSDFQTQFNAFVKEVQTNYTQHLAELNYAVSQFQQAAEKILSLQNEASLTGDEMINQTMAIIDGLESDQAKMLVKVFICPHRGSGHQVMHGRFTQFDCHRILGTSKETANSGGPMRPIDLTRAQNKLTFSETA